ncbi:MAG: response regulator transcription factor [Motiliproteus sp.]
MIKVIAADSSPLYRQGIAIVLSRMAIATQFIPVSGYQALKDEVDLQQGAVIVIVDYRLPGLFDISALKELIAEHGLKVIMLTDNNNVAFTRWVLANGIKRVISKTSCVDELETEITAVLGNQACRDSDLVDDPDLAGDELWVDPETVLSRGLRRLSKQEQVVLHLVRSGMRNKQVASEMGLSVHTIKSHLSSVMNKLRIENRTRLALLNQNIVEDYLSVPFDSAQSSGTALAVV